MEFSPPILSLLDVIGDPVDPAAFPLSIVRFRNQKWAELVGLGDLSDAQWIAHFARFEPFPGNLPRPLALRYHGHQFGTYNPQLGDGRGFLFAQLPAPGDRVLDLGTKGSGQTPYSRQGDGRLTLKGAVREILASGYLEALGVNTSKTFSVIETGEALHRGDEPSPTRSAVMVRLQHSHIRFGSFQRLAYLEDVIGLERLLEHCIDAYHPGARRGTTSETACAFLGTVSDATARMVGQWMAAGFVHGVMNTDNFNITGETFDFGPFRFLAESDPNFVAAYFDQTGLYRFGRQPTQALWALKQLGSALLSLSTSEDLAEALTGFEATYQDAFAQHTFFLLGVKPPAHQSEVLTFLQSFYAWMTESGASWPLTFFELFGGSARAFDPKATRQSSVYETESFSSVLGQLHAFEPDRPERLQRDYFRAAAPVRLVIEDIEALWEPIAKTDDWSAF
ncbi:MAG: YdiU family protein, partial [Pseudomonadota bacterium]